MGKRSNFERIERDFYRTWDHRALPPLLARMASGTRFVEPCAGDGVLLDQLEADGHRCVEAYDIEPWGHGVSPWWRGIAFGDALVARPSRPFDCFITNPPWRRDVLHPLIVHLSDQAPTWLLFDADWAHTRQSIPYLPRLREIVSVGRLRWIPNSPHDAVDNCAWHLFDRPQDNEPAAFHGRRA